MVDTFEDQFPIRVNIGGKDARLTEGFYWLWSHVLRNNLDRNQVFTVLDKRVAFRAEYRDIAMEFKLRFS